jgi:rRNA maturation endonuclease Nob1
MLIERERACPGCGQIILVSRMTCPMCGEKVYRALVEKERKAREDPDISKGFIHRGLR